jgi:ParB-like chromosome segregation protein Spo0J
MSAESIDPPRYQLLPALAPEEFAELRADIEARGVQVPVEFDEAGNILDGHHRVAICKELGIAVFPFITRKGMLEADKILHIRKLNLARRHLDRDQRRALVEQQLKETPQASDRKIASGLDLDHKTVAAAREHMESTGEIPQSGERVGADGRKRAAKRTRKAAKPKTTAPPSNPEPESTTAPAAAEASPSPDTEITIYEAIKILKRIFAHRNIVYRWRGDKQIVGRLHNQLYRAEQRLAEWEVLAIAAAKAERAKQAKA